MATATSTPTRSRYQLPSSAGEFPVLVGLLAVLIGLFGIFFVTVGIVALAAASGVAGWPALAALTPFVGGLNFAGTLTLVFGAVLVMVAAGLWDLEAWALYITGIALGGVIVLLAEGSSFGWSLVIAGVLLVYLIAVRDRFH
jgi:hypothetical protein